MIWTSIDTWIVVAGILSALSCALLGNFLLLRRMSMMGDAISHAILPGLAIAFLWTGQRSSFVMFIGAAFTGVLVALFTQWIHRFGKVEQGASMGVAFSTLFALGLVLIRQAADHVHIDAECVLIGALELVPSTTWEIGGLFIPRAVIILSVVLLLNIGFVFFLFKELKISSFDPQLATTLGIPSSLMHYLMMVFVAITATAAFESVGSILVIAMMIVPAAIAHLLTERLSAMIWISLLMGALAAVLGHLSAVIVPGWFGLHSVSTSSMMAVVSGLLFLVVIMVAPQHGLISKWVHRRRLSLRIVCEDLLGILYRLEEGGAAGATHRQLRSSVPATQRMHKFALWRLSRKGFIQQAEDAVVHLSEGGRSHARSLIRAHRLWESYLDKHFVLPADHLHASAEQLEHVTDAAFQHRLETDVDSPEKDPHGKSIPGKEKDKTL